VSGRVCHGAERPLHREQGGKQRDEEVSLSSLVSSRSLSPTQPLVELPLARSRRSQAAMEKELAAKTAELATTEGMWRKKLEKSNSDAVRPGPG
jgi:hypothetical protein